MSMRIRGCRPARRFAAPAFGLGALLCSLRRSRRRCPPEAWSTAAFEPPSTTATRFIGCAASSVIRSISSSSPEKSSPASARRYRRIVLRRPGQSSVLEAQGGEGGDEFDRAHQPASLSLRLHRAGTTSHGGRSGVIYSLRFTYPPLPSESAASQARSDSIRSWSMQGPSGRATSDYWYCGRPALKPVAASDDGIHTRLRFAANSDLPAIFVRNEDGSESLLNFNMDAGDVIVHRVAHRFIVRRGKLAGCVVNRGYTGGGTRLDSGTVTPDVERRVQGACHE